MSAKPPTQPTIEETNQVKIRIPDPNAVMQIAHALLHLLQSFYALQRREGVDKLALDFIYSHSRRPMHLEPTLHFMCGKAGAGKTTVANGLALEHAAILISEDIWMMRLFGDQMKSFDDYLHFSPKLKSVVGPLAAQLLKSGNHVVLDFQANTKAGRCFFRSIFEQADAAHVLHFVQTSDQVCLERIAKRNIERPDGSHHLTEEVFALVSSYFQVPEAAEGFNIKVHGVDTQ